MFHKLYIKYTSVDNPSMTFICVSYLFYRAQEQWLLSNGDSDTGNEFMSLKEFFRPVVIVI